MKSKNIENVPSFINSNIKLKRKKTSSDNSSIKRTSNSLSRKDIDIENAKNKRSIIKKIFKNKGKNLESSKFVNSILNHEANFLNEGGNIKNNIFNENENIELDKDISYKDNNYIIDRYNTYNIYSEKRIAKIKEKLSSNQKAILIELNQISINRKSIYMRYIKDKILSEFKYDFIQTKLINQINELSKGIKYFWVKVIENSGFFKLNNKDKECLKSLSKIELNLFENRILTEINKKMFESINNEKNKINHNDNERKMTLEDYFESEENNNNDSFENLKYDKNNKNNDIDKNKEKKNSITDSLLLENEDDLIFSRIKNLFVEKSIKFEFNINDYFSNLYLKKHFLFNIKENILLSTYSTAVKWKSEGCDLIKVNKNKFLFFESFFDSFNSHSYIPFEWEFYNDLFSNCVQYYLNINSRLYRMNYYLYSAKIQYNILYNNHILGQEKIPIN